MVTTRGKSKVSAFLAKLPREIEEKLLRGAAKAAGKVLATEAQSNVPSGRVRKAIKTRTGKVGDKISARVGITAKDGFIYSLAHWFEYGTSPHFISVDPSFSEGRTARRINDLDQQAAKERRPGPGLSLFINGKPVGSTVYHPGSRAIPYLRPALDTKGAEARAAAQAYINKRVTKAGIIGAAEKDGDPE